MARSSQHSILIVSGSEKFDALAKKSLRPGLFMSAEFRRSASAARQCLPERYYDMIVVNAPLPDEVGIDFCLDAAEGGSASVLLVVPASIYEDVLERVTDEGILTIAKPFPHGRLDIAIRFLAAQQDERQRLLQKVRAAEEKAEEVRIVAEAKFLLVEKMHMTEDAAHRLIGKEAMDHGISRRKAAERILESE